MYTYFSQGGGDGGLSFVLSTTVGNAFHTKSLCLVSSAWVLADINPVQQQYHCSTGGSENSPNFRRLTCMEDGHALQAVDCAG